MAAKQVKSAKRSILLGWVMAILLTALEKTCSETNRDVWILSLSLTAQSGGEFNHWRPKNLRFLRNGVTFY